METQANCLFVKRIFQVGLHGPVSDTSLGRKPALAPLARIVRAMTVSPLGDLSHVTVPHDPLHGR